MRQLGKDELTLRHRFLVSSRETIAKRLTQLNEEFQREVLRVSAEITTARRLRGESLEAPKELYAEATDEREEVSRAARERLRQLAREESEAVKELTYRAVNQPVKGKRLRELLGEIKRAEQRLERLDKDISRLEGLMRQGTTQQ